MNDVSELFGAIERLSDTNDVVVGVDAYERFDEIIALRIRLNFEGDIEPQEIWSIECHGAIEFRFVEDCWGDFEITDDHPLRKLWSEPFTDLYFAAAPSCPATVVGELVQIFDDEFQDWISLRELLPINLASCITIGFGKLSTGPASTISLMEAVLLKHRMKPSKLSTPASWKPALPVPKSPTVLTIGRNFVVAESFTARRS